METSGAEWVVRLTDAAGHRVGIYGYSFDLNPAAVANICDDKVATSQLLAAAGIDAVPHELVIAPEFGRWVGQSSVGLRTEELIASLGWPLAVKPNDGTGGADVFRATDRGAVETALTAILARHRGAALGPWRDVTAEHRVVVVDGAAPLIYRKDRPRVTGDGVSTVAELVARALGDGRVGPPIVRDWLDTHEPALLTQVPDAAEVVHLGLRHNLGAGSVPVLVPEGELAEELSSLALAASAELGAVFASVDVVDSAAGREVLEVNSGVMLERLAATSPRWWARAAEVYEAALLLALEP
jgi:glutathione synthase/RimK-type ligase-like ATP-grasp enzyme